MSCLRLTAKSSSWRAPLSAVGSVPVDPLSIPGHSHWTSHKHRCMLHRRTVFHSSNMSKSQSRTMGSAWILRRFVPLPTFDPMETRTPVPVKYQGPRKNKSVSRRSTPLTFHWDFCLNDRKRPGQEETTPKYSKEKTALPWGLWATSTRAVACAFASPATAPSLDLT